jgi:hypothetical protein
MKAAMDPDITGRLAAIDAAAGKAACASGPAAPMAPPSAPPVAPVAASAAAPVNAYDVEARSAAATTSTNPQSPGGASDAPAEVGGGSAFAKINEMFRASPKCFNLCCGGMARVLEPTEGPCPNAFCTRAFFGAWFYGILFVPFTFALLQQTMIEGVALDPFAATGTPSPRAWAAAFLFLIFISMYCLISMTSMPESFYEAGSLRLSMLLGGVVAAVWVQQSLTLRYILLRPELSELRKNRTQKYRLCGNAYSTLNPRNLTNYIFLSVVVAEFLLFASVSFHPSLPWRRSGSREQDEAPLAFLSGFLSEALIGQLYEGFQTAILVMLLVIVALYLLLLGDIVYQKRKPSSVGSAIVCEFMAGTLFTTVVGRLLRAAFTLDNDIPGNTFARFLAAIAVFLFATTAVFVAVLRVNTVRANAEKEGKKKGADVRFKPKWLAVERMMKGSVGIFAALLGNLRGINRTTPTYDANGTVIGSSSLDALDANEELLSNLGPVLFITFSILIVLLHLFLLKRWHPTCSVTFVTRARRLLLYIALYGQFISLAMLLVPWEMWFSFLFGGWIFAFIVLTLFAIYKVFFAEPHDGEPIEVKEMRRRDQIEQMQKSRRGRIRLGLRRAATKAKNSIVAIPSFMQGAPGAPGAPPPPAPPAGGFASPGCASAAQPAPGTYAPGNYY